METIIVLLIVGLASATGVWTFCRTIKGKGSCSCSQSCQACGNSKSDM